jgi:DNA polymerase-3 subunit beta
MKLSVTRQELLDRLSEIQNIVEKRSTMPVLSHFLLDARADGSSITATDIETALREPIAVQVESEGKLCIPARKLFEIVREMEDDITIESVDSQWIKVTSGRSAFRLACLSPDEFPSWPELEQATQVTVACKTLEGLIERTLYSAGESDTRYTLNGLLFHFIGPDFIVVGTDGHRMAMVKTTAERTTDDELKVIVPRKTANEIRKFLNREDESVSISVGSNHILFRIADMEFLARQIEGSYPNYTQVLPTRNDKTITVGRTAFIRALKRVSVISKERSNAVKVEIADGILRLSSSNPDLGEASDEIAVSFDGEAFEAGFNARYLLDVLGAMTTDSIRFELLDQLSPTLLKEEAGDDYKCVVMPMRI